MLSILECRISGMSCAACVLTIEKHSKTLPGVLEASINLALAKGSFTFNSSKVSLEAIVEAVEDVGFDCEVLGMRVAEAISEVDVLRSGSGISLAATTPSRASQYSGFQSGTTSSGGSRHTRFSNSESHNVSILFDNEGEGYSDTQEERSIGGSGGGLPLAASVPICEDVSETSSHGAPDAEERPTSLSVSARENPVRSGSNIEVGIFSLVHYAPVVASDICCSQDAGPEGAGTVFQPPIVPGVCGPPYRAGTGSCCRTAADTGCQSRMGSTFGLLHGVLRDQRLPWNWMWDSCCFVLGRRKKVGGYFAIRDATVQTPPKPPSLSELQSFVAYTKSLPGVVSCSWKDINSLKSDGTRKLWCGEARKQPTCTIMYDSDLVGPRDLCDGATEYFKNEWTLSPQPSVSAHKVLLKEHHKFLSKFLFCAIPAAIVGVLAMIPLESLPPFLRAMPWPGVTRCALLMLLLTSPIHFLGGWSFHRNALKGLLRGYATMDLLVSISTNITFFFALLSILCSARSITSESHGMAPHFFETPAVVITAVLLGKTIEAGVKAVTSKSLQRETGVSEKPCRVLVPPAGAGGPNSPKWNQWSRRSVERALVQLGDVLLSESGEVIPADGVILECLAKPAVPFAESRSKQLEENPSTATVDEAVVTGEAFPVVKAAGDKVVGGSMVQEGGLIYRVVNVGRHSFVGKVEAMVEAANASKSTTQIRADRVSLYFIPAVLALATVTVIVWTVLVASGVVKPMYMGPHGSQSERNPSLFDVVMFVGQFGIAVIAVACPCSLGLATPTAIAAATGRAASCGLLVKDIHVLERAAKKVSCVVFDKTGTLTDGALQLDQIYCSTPSLRFVIDYMALEAAHEQTTLVSNCFDESRESRIPRGLAEQLLLWCAASVQGQCSHPIARSLRRACRSSSRSSSSGWKRLPPLESPRNFREVSGAGVEGDITLRGWCSLSSESLAHPADAARRASVELQSSMNYNIARQFRVVVGSSSYVKSMLHQSSTTDLLFADGSGMSHTDGCCVYVAIDGNLVGRFDFRDSPRPEAASIVATLKEQLRCEVWMLSGDGFNAAARVAELVGIPKCNVRGGLRPEAKIGGIRQLLLRSKNSSVVMVGDGINDAGALAAATIGISVGAASSLVVTAADIVSVRHSLESLPLVFDLARATRRVVWLNYFWAFAFNLVSLPLAAGIMYPRLMLPPAVAGLFMAGSSAGVVFNSLALLFIPMLRPRGPDTTTAGALLSDDIDLTDDTDLTSHLDTTGKIEGLAVSDSEEA